MFALRVQSRSTRLERLRHLLEEVWPPYLRPRGEGEEAEDRSRCDLEGDVRVEPKAVDKPEGVDDFVYHGTSPFLVALGAGLVWHGTSREIVAIK